MAETNTGHGFDVGLLSVPLHCRPETWIGDFREPDVKIGNPATAQKRGKVVFVTGGKESAC